MDLSDFDDIQSRITHVAVAATAADTTLVSAVTGSQIVVVQAALFVDTETTIRFESGTGGTALTGIMNIYAKQGDALDPGAANGQFILPFSPAGWFKTALSTLLNLEKAGGNVNGVIGYVLG